MRRKDIINYLKSINFKEIHFKINWFSYKRRWFTIKYVVIISILVVLFFFILVHNIVAESNVYTLIANFSLNYSFILIPALLYLLEVRRNFKKELENIFSLKNSLIYLRRYIAGEISGLKNDVYRDIIINPSNINQITGLLRSFKFNEHAAMFLTYIEDKRLFHIDVIIIDVVNKIKKYDSGKDFKSIEQTWKFKRTIEIIEKLEMKSDVDSLKEHFLDDLTFPLVYSLFLNNPIHSLAMFYYNQEEQKLNNLM